MENFKHLSKPFEKVINTITLAGGRFIFVGGCVRDVFLHEPSKDTDAEVYGLPMDKLKQALELVDIVSEVGKQFGVLKLTNYPIDISLPRFDTKIGSGHKGFSVRVDYSISFKQAAKRRDLTINAIGFDPLKNEILDPYGGVSDIRNGILRAVDPKTFVEDPLRGLRVAQFSSRFLMTPHESLLNLCKTLNLRELPNERISEEIRKLLIKGKEPSRGLIFLKETNLLNQIFPALDALSKNQWNSILERLDQMASEPFEHEEKKLVFMMGVLCFYLPPLEAQRFLGTHTLKEKLKNRILILLENAQNLLENSKELKRGDLFWIGSRLQKKGSCWHDLILFLKFLAPSTPFITQLSERVLGEGAAHPKNLEPIVTGEYLIKRGFRPNKDFSALLKKCLKVQYEEGIKDPGEILSKIL